MRLADPVLADADFDGEGLGVLRPLFADDEIARRRQLQSLRHFLQGALIIRHGAIHASFGHREGADHVRFDERARGVEAAVQVDRRDQRFHGVRQQSFLGASSAHLLAAAEEQEIAQRQRLRHFVETGGAHQVSLELGQTAFRRGRKAAHQAVADHEPQDGVAQELQLLVIAGGADPRPAARAFWICA